MSLYDAFCLPNIGRAKRSKLLHIQRPWLFPISDSRVDALYSAIAAEQGDSGGEQSRGYWDAIRRDLVDGEAELRAAASQLTERADEQRLARLTPLRLLDIAAWQLAGCVEISEAWP